MMKRRTGAGDLSCAAECRGGGTVILEETSSGNLRLFAPTNRDAAVRFTRADVRVMADVFARLDVWSREASEPSIIDDEPSRA